MLYYTLFDFSVFVIIYKFSYIVISTEGYLVFETSATVPVFKPLRVWDQQIAVTCSELSVLAKKAESL